MNSRSLSVFFAGTTTSRTGVGLASWARPSDVKEPPTREANRAAHNSVAVPNFTLARNMLFSASWDRARTWAAMAPSARGDPEASSVAARLEETTSVGDRAAGAAHSPRATADVT